MEITAIFGLSWNYELLNLKIKVPEEINYKPFYLNAEITRPFQF